MEEQIKMELDGQAFAVSSDMNFGAASIEVISRMGKERVLSEIYVGQKAVDLDEEQRLAQVPISKLEPIRFVSKKVEDLLRESSVIAVSICESIAFECQDIDQYFESNDMVKAHERVGELGALVDWLLQLMSGLRSYGKDTFLKHQVSVGPVETAMAGMERSLLSLHGYLAAQQYEAFRAELKKGFQDEIGVWKEVFSAVATHWTPRA